MEPVWHSRFASFSWGECDLLMCTHILCSWSSLIRSCILGGRFLPNLKNVAFGDFEATERVTHRCYCCSTSRAQQLDYAPPASTSCGHAQMFPTPPPIPPSRQEITVIQHGLIGVIPVHALPLEEVSSNGEPGRPRSRAAGRPPSAGAARGAIGGGGAGSVAPLAVLDRCA